MHVGELLDVIFRWAHLVAGIMWVGNSMLFNWLDRNLERSAGDDPLSQGRIHMVHSGAFYEVEKKLLAPGQMPANLHWFKYQNLSTWLTGIALLVVVYYFNGAAFLVDPSVRDLAPSVAISISAGALLVGWLLYDGLWQTLGGQPRLATAISIAGLFAAAYGFTLVFSGRAAYIETGVLMGTIMTGNVWMVIVPSQRELVAATIAGRPQDKTLSLRAKERSIHNNYMTFPLLFIMLSTHFPSASSNGLNWLVLIVVMVGGSGVRHFMNVRYAGKVWLGPAFAMAAIAIAGLTVVTRLSSPPVANVQGHVPFARVQEIMLKRCVPCHSEVPRDPQFSAPPSGVVFDSPERIQIMADRIKERAFTTGTMPFVNRTQITDTERAELARWVDDGAKIP
jgi:uncharacterized membrane protein